MSILSDQIKSHLPSDWPSWAIDVIVASRPAWIANPARDFMSVVQISNAIWPQMVESLRAGRDRGEPSDASWLSRLDTGFLDAEAFSALYLTDQKP